MIPTHTHADAFRHQQRLILMMALFMETMPFHAGYCFHGLNLRDLGDRWQLILKLERDEQHYVSFFEGKDPWDCLYNCALAVKHGKVSVTTDRYATKP
jgi:hypothetical protein